MACPRSRIHTARLRCKHTPRRTVRTHMAYTKLFTDACQAKAYASCRPRYPPTLYEHIFDYLGLKPGTQKLPLAVDIATGSGQVLHGLHGHFERMIGLDASEQQLEAAEQMAGVKYMVGDAHNIPLGNGEANLVTVGQALHWFDRPRFYKEAARILRPTGVLAAWTYGGGNILPVGGAADRVYNHMLNGLLGPYWAGPRELVDAMYTTVEPMDPYFRDTTRKDLTMEQKTSVDDVVGYVASWSAYRTYRKQHSDLPDPLEQFREQLLQAVETDGTAVDNLVMTRPIALLMARGPKNHQ